MPQVRNLMVFTQSQSVAFSSFHLSLFSILFSIPSLQYSLFRTHLPYRYYWRKKIDTSGYINMAPKLRYLTSHERIDPCADTILLSDLLLVGKSQKLNRLNGPFLKRRLVLYIYSPFYQWFITGLLILLVHLSFSTMFPRPSLPFAVVRFILITLSSVLFLSFSLLTKVNYFTFQAIFL